MIRKERARARYFEALLMLLPDSGRWTQSERLEWIDLCFFLVDRFYVIEEEESILDKVRLSRRGGAMTMTIEQELEEKEREIQRLQECVRWLEGARILGDLLPPVGQEHRPLTKKPTDSSVQEAFINLTRAVVALATERNAARSLARTEFQSRYLKADHRRAALVRQYPWLDDPDQDDVVRLTGVGTVT